MNFTRIGAISGALGVALGAFAAHVLRHNLASDMMEVWDLGARYQMIHAPAILLVGLGAGAARPRLQQAAGWLFTIGTVLFSGSLYTLALTGVDVWGAVTPLGGASFIAGWVVLAIAAAR